MASDFLWPVGAGPSDPAHRAHAAVAAARAFRISSDGQSDLAPLPASLMRKTADIQDAPESPVALLSELLAASTAAEVLASQGAEQIWTRCDSLHHQTVLHRLGQKTSREPKPGTITLLQQLTRNLALDKIANQSDLYGRTALHYAAEAGFDGFVQFLLERGSNPRALDSLRNSALLYAIRGAHTDTARLLLATFKNGGRLKP
jgi:hypothetical protein